MDCSACKQSIVHDSDFLKCITCTMKYHIECLNITSGYYKKNKIELDKLWHCPSCENVTRRIKNDNTPIRKSFQPTLDDTTMSIDELILDEPNKTKNEHCEIRLNQQKSSTQIGLIENTTILDQISYLLDKKLEENNTTVLGEIKNIIQQEIKHTTEKLIHDIYTRIDKTASEQLDIQQKISTLNNTIENLNIENKNLQKEISHIKNRLSNLIIPDKQYHDMDVCKKIVLYGLKEQKHEMDDHLQYRIIHIFYDILNIDLTGYIEDITRIGRNNSHRPIVIELLSKKMAKYILKCAHLFRNTGLSISEYLNENGRQIRKNLQEQLHAARQKGHHAVIRNNKLYVNGKSHTYQNIKITPISQPHEEPSTRRSYSIATEPMLDTTSISTTHTKAHHNFRN